MALFVDDIGEALEDALIANASSFSGALGSPEGTLAVFYNDTPEQGNLIGSHCYIRFDSMRPVQQFADSELAEFTYTARFELTDLAGKNKALAVVQKGLANTFANRGVTALATYLTESSNRLGASGRIEWEAQAEPLEGLSDYDQGKVNATIRVTCWRNIPEV